MFDAPGLMGARIDHGRDEIKGHIRIGDDTEQCLFPVPDLVQLQVVALHELTDLFNVKGSHTSAAGNQD